MILVVANTSVYVSALVFGGVPQLSLAQAMRKPYRIVVSREIENELAQTLSAKFGWPRDRIAYAGEQLWDEAPWCEPGVVKASRDPNDDHILGCALAAGAKFVVTGDKDLLELHPFRGIAVVTPAQFLATAKEK